MQVDFSCYHPFIILFRQSMYEKDKSLALQIIQYTNLAIILLFLLLFSYRLYTLRSFSLTDKFKNYFPKIRIFFCLCYVALSASLLGYNIATDSYSDKAWYEYVLQGGGGECIDSLILIIQLGVLRLQLKKEQPYTPYHIWYFVYLMIMSLARCTLTAIDTINGANDLANAIISGLLVTDSVGQFAYWIKNKQSLPDFFHHTHQEIDESRYQSQFLQRRVEITKRSLHSVINDNFPYITSFVSISHGRIKINLERTVLKLGSSVHDEDCLNESFLDRETALSHEFLASNDFTVEEIKKFYTVCGRFALKKQLNFSLDLRSFIKQFQVFLEKLFEEKKCYAPSILKFLKIPQSTLDAYQHLLQKMYIVENKGAAIDMNTGFQMLQDRAAPFLSLNLYRFMWVHDHYEFYMRIAIKEGALLSYPIKRLEEIEEQYLLMKKIVKIQGKAIELPSWPKMHSFVARDDEAMKESIGDLEVFMRKLFNEEAVIEDAHLRQKMLEFLGYERQARVIAKHRGQSLGNIKIMKGRISKALIKSEYITLYEFKLIKNGVQFKSIRKRFREIDVLHHDIQRWLKNRRAGLAFTLPQKVLYKPEIRHQKLKHYLECVLEVKEVFKCYGVALFFDLPEGEEQQQSFLGKSDRSVAASQRFSSNIISEYDSLIHEELSNSPKESRSSRNFSKILDDLGNEEYD